MAFDAYFKLSSYCLIATGFIALALTGRVDLFSVVLYSGALIWSYASERPRSKLRLPGLITKLAPILYLPIVPLDLYLLSRSPISALIHFTLFMSILKLFQEKQDRDWLWLYVIALFEILLAAGLTLDQSFLASILAFGFFSISTLAAFEIRKARAQVNSIEKTEMLTGGPRSGRRLHSVRYLVGASLALMILITALAMPIFFALPRFGAGWLGQSFANTQVLTGFSDTVKLGDVARIKQDSRVVMRVRVEGAPQGAYLRWRGVTLDYYFNGRWINSHSQPMTEAPRGRSGVFELQTIQSVDDALSAVKQTFYVEPLNRSNIFAAGKVLAIDSKNFDLYRDGAGTLISSTTSRKSYIAYSDISTPSERELASELSNSYPADISRTYLQLPTLDPRIGELARQITAAARGPYEKARAIERYLKTKYDYTLELNRTDSGDPVADFLFNTRAGHCEYFASSMALMLRSIGIPSRIVNGYQMGEYNMVGDLYTVRQKDAHSWVEAYFSRSDAWIEFDPTPAAGINSYSDSYWSRLGKLAEAFEFFWLEYVVSFDAQEQISLMRDIQIRAFNLREALVEIYQGLAVTLLGLVNRGWGRDGLLWRAVTGSAILALMLAASLFLLWWRKQLILTGYGGLWSWVVSLLRQRAPQQSAIIFYNQMLLMLLRRGIERRADQTPQEFAAQVGLPEVKEVTEIYNRTRFGQASLSALDLKRVQWLLREIKRKLK